MRARALTRFTVLYWLSGRSVRQKSLPQPTGQRPGFALANHRIIYAHDGHRFSGGASEEDLIRPLKLAERSKILYYRQTEFAGQVEQLNAGDTRQNFRTRWRRV